MKNDPAFPRSPLDTPCLTKREYAAIHLLATMPHYEIQDVKCVIRTVDLLFKELEETNERG